LTLLMSTIDPSTTPSKRPLCLPCWRKHVSMVWDPPTWAPGEHEEVCDICSRRTTAGIYLDSPTKLTLKPNGS